jgi:hypothetical protein
MSYKRVEGRYDRFKRYLELSFSSAPPARKALVARVLTTQTINCPGNPVAVFDKPGEGI